MSDRLKNDIRTAPDLDAHLRACGVRVVVTTIGGEGARVHAYIDRAPWVIGAVGLTSSHAFDAMLGLLAEVR
jgi:S-adenosylmethionine:diacylglycerol 3-amino-3-carboxypropyl transferase